MNRLQAELRRLYLLDSPAADGTDAGESALVSPEGTVRALVLELARPANWTALSVVWRGVQIDLELPAPAIALSGSDGFQLWFSLSEPVSLIDARRFLEALRQRYLSGIASARIGMLPAVDDTASGSVRHATPVPAPGASADQWSAYVAPDLAAVFADEPWLDICPSPDAQADVLARLASTKIAHFRSALDQLDAAATTAQAAKAAIAPAAVDGDRSSHALNAAGAECSTDTPNPKQFLLSVMDDKSIDMHLRIQAAQALLPYF